MLRFRIPDIVLGATLGITISAMGFFAVGFSLGSSQYPRQSAQTQSAEKPGDPESKNEQQEGFWERSATDPIAIFTLCLVFVGVFQVGLFYVQLRLIRKSLDDAKMAAEAARDGVKVARDEFISMHRPKLRVRNISITQHYAMNHLPKFRESQNLIGQFYISNIGGADATIVESLCFVLPTNRGLPMTYPYEQMPANNPAPRITLRPGKSMQANFGAAPLTQEQAENINNFKNSWRIYVMGWVEYTDALDMNMRWRTAFCRERRQPREGDDPRFYPVKDEPDYEHEE